jgi:hypothetical protein
VFGCYCANGSQNVYSMYLPMNGLTGRHSLSAFELGLLKDRLQGLSLSGTNLSRTILSEFGQLPHLKTLHLDGNAFSGSLPTGIGELQEFVVTDVERLTGTIPTGLGAMLSRNDNWLSGLIPTELGAVEDHDAGRVRKPRDWEHHPSLTSLTLLLTFRPVAGLFQTRRVDAPRVPVAAREPVDGRPPVRAGQPHYLEHLD